LKKWKASLVLLASRLITEADVRAHPTARRATSELRCFGYMVIVDSKGKPNDLIQILKSEMEEAEGVMLVGWHNETVEEDM
jgi:hypothetical protein